MLVVQGVGPGYKYLVPQIISRLVCSNQENRHPPRVVRAKPSIWPPMDLCPEFPHVRASGRRHPTAVGEGQMGSVSLRESGRRCEPVLFLGCQ